MKIIIRALLYREARLPVSQCTPGMLNPQAFMRDLKAEPTNEACGL